MEKLIIFHMPSRPSFFECPSFILIDSYCSSVNYFGQEYKGSRRGILSLLYEFHKSHYFLVQTLADNILLPLLWFSSKHKFIDIKQNACDGYLIVSFMISLIQTSKFMYVWEKRTPTAEACVCFVFDESILGDFLYIREMHVGDMLLPFYDCLWTLWCSWTL